MKSAYIDCVNSPFAQTRFSLRTAMDWQRRGKTEYRQQPLDISRSIPQELAKANVRSHRLGHGRLPEVRVVPYFLGFHSLASF